MNLVTEALRTENVHLDLKACSPADALEEILRELRGDERVKDWARLRESLIERASMDPFRGIPAPIFLHHCRTSSVAELVLAAACHPKGLSLENQPEIIRLIFVAAIPEALNSEYLRILGAIARVCGDPITLAELLKASSPEDFVSLLERGCSS